MGALAREVCHAELAWSIDAWMRDQLDVGVLSEIDAARRDALARLVDGAAPTPDPALSDPDAETHRRLVEGLAERISAMAA